jgi:hypothetical protein
MKPQEKQTDARGGFGSGDVLGRVLVACELMTT